MKKNKKYPIFFLLLTIVMANLICNIAVGQTAPLGHIEEKISEISQAEKRIIEYLFNLGHQIEKNEEEAGEVAREINTLEGEIDLLKRQVEITEKDFQKNQQALGETLRTYQRMGPGTYLEILLDSTSIRLFLKKLNLLRDISRNTQGIMDNLRRNEKELNIEKEKLSDKLLLVEKKHKNLKEKIEAGKELLGEREEYLASLGEERELYQEHLLSFQRAWEDVGLLFVNMLGEFNRIIKKDNLPTNIVKTTITFAGIKGSIEEETLNRIIEEYSNIGGLQFAFSPGEVKIILMEGQLELMGAFTIIDGKRLKFNAENGSFYGLELGAMVVEKLFKGLSIELDLGPLLGRNSLQSVKTLDGSLELTSKLSIL